MMGDDQDFEPPKPGDEVWVLGCRHCQHLVHVLAVPSDAHGRPSDAFAHLCPVCGREDRYSRTDLRRAIARLKN